MAGRGNVYTTYFGLSHQFNQVMSKREDYNDREFSADATRLAGFRDKRRYRSPAENGRIIEMAQILTTHNLVQLVHALGDGGLGMTVADWRAAAEQTWRWICTSLLRMPDDYHSRLLVCKNSAFAWRQLVFYLSRCDADTSWEAVAYFRSTLKASDDRKAFYVSDEDVRSRLQEVMLSPLEAALKGTPPRSPLLGWVTSRPALMPGSKERAGPGHGPWRVGEGAAGPS